MTLIQLKNNNKKIKIKDVVIKKDIKVILLINFLVIKAIT